MGGGLMQLVAYGAQDVYLTGNPQITFFKVVYRRHTNFSMESIRQVWTGDTSPGNKDGEITSTISRNGDLVYGLHMEMGIEINGNITNAPMSVIKTVECEIGGQLIDRQTGEWMALYSELTEGGDTCQFFNNMLGGAIQMIVDQRQVYHIPFRFWFCRNPGNALPLIALQYHEVKINLTYQDIDSVTTDYNNLYADYIYLDTDERRRFAQVSHEYLIEQVQLREFNNVASVMDLNFNHPVKELVWCVKRLSEKVYKPVDIPGTTDVTDTSWDPTRFQLKLNGHDRFSERPVEYFTQYQTWRHHTGTCTALDNENHAVFNSIAVYSFALKPEEHQPSGTCNFSRIDSAQLIMTGHAGTNDYNVYAVNYNVLRVMSGMGGLAYSN